MLLLICNIIKRLR